MESYDVVIVGAGVWGLCAAHTFLTINPSLSLLIVDSKKSIGGVWAAEQLYPGLRTNNLQTYYEYSDFPMLETGLNVKSRGIMTGETMHAYFNAYAKRFALVDRIRLESEVVRAVECEDKADGGWNLEIRSLAGDGRISSIACTKLIIATGQASVPNKMTFKGLSSFTKPAIHSVDLGKAAPTLLGEDFHDITIVGGSKSAHDAVYMFATAGKRVTWLIHGPHRGRGSVPMAKPYMRFGPWSVWREGLLLLRPITWFGIAPWSDGDGFGWIRWFLHRTSLGGALVRSYHTQTGRRAGQQSGILDDARTRRLIPDSTMQWYGTQANSLNYDQDFYQLVRDGKVDIVRGDIEYLDGDSIFLGDRVIHTDALVCATGYDYSVSVPLEPASKRLGWGCPVDPSCDDIFPDLDSRADIELFSRFPILRSSPPQPERRPTGLTPWRLWRFIAPPSQVSRGESRNLAFLNNIAAFQTTIKAEITSLWAYAYLYDKLTVGTPSQDEAQYEAALWSRFGKWRVPYGMQGKSADFFLEAMPYYDLLLRDLGLRSWRKGWGWLGEIFGGRYEVRHYKGIIDEWMSKQKDVVAVT